MRIIIIIAHLYHNEADVLELDDENIKILPAQPFCVCSSHEFIT